jgi:uncharacterized protein (TIGR02001 family)
MMKKVKAIISMLSIIGLSAPALAQDDGVTLNLSGGVASDYRFRSISQTDRNPFAFALASAQYKDFYVRVGGENVDFNDGTDAEYDLYAGWAPTYGNTSLDIGVVRYGYIGAPDGPNRDTVEYKAAVTQAFGKGTIGAKAFYAPDFLTLDTRALYTEINGSYALTPRLTASGAYGVEQIHRFRDFQAWNLGATYALTKALAFDVRYYDTDSHSNGTTYHSAVVAALKFSI